MPLVAEAVVAIEPTKSQTKAVSEANVAAKIETGETTAAAKNLPLEVPLAGVEAPKTAMAPSVPLAAKVEAQPATSEVAQPLAPQPSAAAAPKDWLGTRLAADMARIGKQPGTRFSVQLMTADERERVAIEAFLRTASRELNPDLIMVYLSGTAQNPKVSVLYGNYSDRAEAISELLALPPKLRQFRPYARAFRSIRTDLRQLPQ